MLRSYTAGFSAEVAHLLMLSSYLSESFVSTTDEGLSSALRCSTAVALEIDILSCVIPLFKNKF